MAQGYKESVAEMCAKIDAVTREVRSIPHSLFRSHFLLMSIRIGLVASSY